MKLQLNNQSAEALFNMFTDDILIETPIELEDKLIMIHMIAIYKKLRLKLEARKVNGYSVTVTDAEALAYWCYFKSRPLDHCPYERNFIIQHVQEIDRQVHVHMYTIKPTVTKLLT